METLEITVTGKFVLTLTPEEYAEYKRQQDEDEISSQFYWDVIEKDALENGPLNKFEMDNVWTEEVAL